MAYISLNNVGFSYEGKKVLSGIHFSVEKGDYLFFHDAGAHGFAMGYNYNGKLWSSELLLQTDGSVKMIRRAEKDTDYFATLDMDEGLSKYLQSRK